MLQKGNRNRNKKKNGKQQEKMSRNLQKPPLDDIGGKVTLCLQKRFKENSNEDVSTF